MRRRLCRLLRATTSEPAHGLVKNTCLNVSREYDLLRGIVSTVACQRIMNPEPTKNKEHARLQLCHTSPITNRHSCPIFTSVIQHGEAIRPKVTGRCQINLTICSRCNCRTKPLFFLRPPCHNAIFPTHLRPPHTSLCSNGCGGCGVSTHPRSRDLTLEREVEVSCDLA